VLCAKDLREADDTRMNMGLQTAGLVLFTIGLIRLGLAILSPILRLVPVPVQGSRRDPRWGAGAGR
jgi:hypothetical protein